jgi:hypothetical protein
MVRGWEVELDDGTIYKEDCCEWKEVPKVRIKRLTLHYDGRRWDLTGKQAYFVRSSASVVPGNQASFQIEKRCVGYYEGKDKVCYIVNEHTGELIIKVE